jgi:uncharacterized FAD-dependent dehydrogenase
LEKYYDVVIIGAGPAGIFSAMELVRLQRNAKVLIIEKGNDIHKRKCPMKIREISCAACHECALLSGWGGAGAFSDGKLNLSPEIGGFLSGYMDTGALQSLIASVDQDYVSYGAPPEVYGENEGEINRIAAIAAANNLRLIPSKIRHIGTDRCRTVLKNIKESLNGRVQTIFNSEAERVMRMKKKAAGVVLKDGTRIHSDFVVLAPGREGSRWLERESKRLRLTLLKNPVDIGVRVEIPSSVLEPLTRITYEPKLIFHSTKFNDRVRTFCVNPYGEVVK